MAKFKSEKQRKAVMAKLKPGTSSGRRGKVSGYDGYEGRKIGSLTVIEARVNRDGYRWDKEREMWVPEKEKRYKGKETKYSHMKKKDEIRVTETGHGQEGSIFVMSKGREDSGKVVKLKKTKETLNGVKVWEITLPDGSKKRFVGRRPNSQKIKEIIEKN